MNEISYQMGVPKELVQEAVALYEEAFGKKISVAIKNKVERIGVLRESFVLDFAFVATENDKLVGIAGIHTSEGSLTGGLGLSGLLSKLGILKGSKAALVLSLFERKPNVGELLMDGISVDSNYRGCGIGGALLEHVKEYARGNKYESIRLDVIDTNPRAKALYERHGFNTVSKDEFPYLRNVLGFGASETMVCKVV